MTDSLPQDNFNPSISVIILTFNSAATLGQTLRAALQVSDDIHLVDSGSSDNGLALAEQIIAATNTARSATHRPHALLSVTHHPFENYGAQRNWAMENLALSHDWVLNLDADEQLSPPLIRAINDIQAVGFPPDINGYFLPRLVRFLGRNLSHGGLYPTWHMRLFRRQFGRCEARLYDQHFLVDGRAERINHPMIDDVRLSLSEWTARHNRWSDAEAAEILLMTEPGKTSTTSGRVTAKWRGGNPIERKRALRGWYQATPLFLRAFLLFLYRYVVRLGFLDGREGLIYLVLQCFWFRFLVDAKLFEQKQQNKPSSEPL